MTFHIMTTLKDARKIGRFLAKQPPLSMPILCVNPIIQDVKSAADLLKIVTDGVDLGFGIMKGFHIFWVEDDTGNVRAAIFIRRKEIIDPTEYSFVLSFAYCAVDNKDYEGNNGFYFKELCTGMANYFGKGGVGEFRLVGNFQQWVKEWAGEGFTLIREDIVKNWTTGEPVHVYLVKVTWDHLIGG